MEKVGPKSGDSSISSTVAQKMSVAEFFSRNASIAGFGNPMRATFTSVRELVENGLDAAENASILPDIRVDIKRLSNKEIRDLLDLKNLSKEKRALDFLQISTKDNGIGVESELIPWLFGRVLTGTKYGAQQTRGTFGLGAKMCLLYAMSTVDLPAKIKSRHINSDETHEYELLINRTENAPIIISHKTYPKDSEFAFSESGTEISVTITGAWSRAKLYILEYFRQLAIITPYANFSLEIPGEKGHEVNTIQYLRVVSDMPDAPQTVPIHPWGCDISQLKSEIASSQSEDLITFLTTHFMGVNKRTAKTFFRTLNIDTEMSPKELTPQETRRMIHEGFQKSLRESRDIKRKKDRTFKFDDPRGDSLSPLGAHRLRRGIEKELAPEFTETITRSPRAYSGHPFVIEAAIGYGGGVTALAASSKMNQQDNKIVYRYANRIPLIFGSGSDVISKAVNNIKWSDYGLTKNTDPLAITVSLVSTKIPFPETSKEYIDTVDEIAEDVRLALLHLARRLHTYLRRTKKKMRERQRSSKFERYAPIVAQSLIGILTKSKRADNSLSFELPKIVSALATGDRRFIRQNLPIGVPLRKGTVWFSSDYGKKLRKHGITNIAEFLYKRHKELISIIPDWSFKRIEDIKRLNQSEINNPEAYNFPTTLLVSKHVEDSFRNAKRTSSHMNISLHNALHRRWIWTTYDYLTNTDSSLIKVPLLVEKLFEQGKRDIYQLYQRLLEIDPNSFTAPSNKKREDKNSKLTPLSTHDPTSSSFLELAIPNSKCVLDTLDQKIKEKYSLNTRFDLLFRKNDPENPLDISHLAVPLTEHLRSALSDLVSKNKEFAKLDPTKFKYDWTDGYTKSALRRRKIDTVKAFLAKSNEELLSINELQRLLNKLFFEKLLNDSRLVISDLRDISLKHKKELIGNFNYDSRQLKFLSTFMKHLIKGMKVPSLETLLIIPSHDCRSIKEFNDLFLFLVGYTKITVLNFHKKTKRLLPIENLLTLEHDYELFLINKGVLMTSDYLLYPSKSLVFGQYSPKRILEVKDRIGTPITTLFSSPSSNPINEKLKEIPLSTIDEIIYNSESWEKSRYPAGVKNHLKEIFLLTSQPVFLLNDTLIEKSVTLYESGVSTIGHFVTWPVNDLGALLGVDTDEIQKMKELVEFDYLQQLYKETKKNNQFSILTQFGFGDIIPILQKYEFKTLGDFMFTNFLFSPSRSGKQQQLVLKIRDIINSDFSSLLSDAFNWAAEKGNKRAPLKTQIKSLISRLNKNEINSFHQLLSLPSHYYNFYNLKSDSRIALSDLIKELRSPLQGKTDLFDLHLVFRLLYVHSCLHSPLTTLDGLNPSTVDRLHDMGISRVCQYLILSPTYFDNYPKSFLPQPLSNIDSIKFQDHYTLLYTENNGNFASSVRFHYGSDTHFSPSEIIALLSHGYYSVEKIYYLINRFNYNLVTIPWTRITHFKQLLASPLGILSWITSAPSQSATDENTTPLENGDSKQDIAHISSEENSIDSTVTSNSSDLNSLSEPSPTYSTLSAKQMHLLSLNGISSVLHFLTAGEHDLSNILDWEIDDIRICRSNIILEESGVDLADLNILTGSQLQILQEHDINTLEGLCFSIREETWNVAEFPIRKINVLKNIVDLPLSYIYEDLDDEVLDLIQKMEIPSILSFILTPNDVLEQKTSIPSERYENIKSNIDFNRLIQLVTNSLFFFPNLDYDSLFRLQTNGYSTILDVLKDSPEKIQTALQNIPMEQIEATFSDYDYTAIDSVRNEGGISLKQLCLFSPSDLRFLSSYNFFSGKSILYLQDLSLSLQDIDVLQSDPSLQEKLMFLKRTLSLPLFSFLDFLGLELYSKSEVDYPQKFQSLSYSPTLYDFLLFIDLVNNDNENSDQTEVNSQSISQLFSDILDSIKQEKQDIDFIFDLSPLFCLTLVPSEFLDVRDSNITTSYDLFCIIATEKLSETSNSKNTKIWSTLQSLYQKSQYVAGSIFHTIYAKKKGKKGIPSPDSNLYYTHLSHIISGFKEADEATHSLSCNLFKESPQLTYLLSLPLLPLSFFEVSPQHLSLLSYHNLLSYESFISTNSLYLSQILGISRKNASESIQKIASSLNTVTLKGRLSLDTTIFSDTELNYLHSLNLKYFEQLILNINFESEKTSSRVSVQKITEKRQDVASSILGSIIHVRHLSPSEHRELLRIGITTLQGYLKAVANGEYSTDDALSLPSVISHRSMHNDSSCPLSLQWLNLSQNLINYLRSFNCYTTLDLFCLLFSDQFTEMKFGAKLSSLSEMSEIYTFLTSPAALLPIPQNLKTELSGLNILYIFEAISLPEVSSSLQPNAYHKVKEKVESSGISITFFLPLDRRLVKLLESKGIQNIQQLSFIEYEQSSFSNENIFSQSVRKSVHSLLSESIHVLPLENEIIQLLRVNNFDTLRSLCLHSEDDLSSLIPESKYNSLSVLFDGEYIPRRLTSIPDDEASTVIGVKTYEGLALEFQSEGYTGKNGKLLQFPVAAIDGIPQSTRLELRKWRVYSFGDLLNQRDKDTKFLSLSSKKMQTLLDMCLRPVVDEELLSYLHPLSHEESMHELLQDVHLFSSANHLTKLSTSDSSLSLERESSSTSNLSYLHISISAFPLEVDNWSSFLLFLQSSGVPTLLGARIYSYLSESDNVWVDKIDKIWSLAHSEQTFILPSLSENSDFSYFINLLDVTSPPTISEFISDNTDDQSPLTTPISLLGLQELSIKLLDSKQIFSYWQFIALPSKIVEQRDGESPKLQKILALTENESDNPALPIPTDSYIQEISSRLSNVSKLTPLFSELTQKTQDTLSSYKITSIFHLTPALAPLLRDRSDSKKILLLSQRSKLPFIHYCNWRIGDSEKFSKEKITSSAKSLWNSGIRSLHDFLYDFVLHGGKHLSSFPKSLKLLDVCNFFQSYNLEDSNQFFIDNLSWFEKDEIRLLQSQGIYSLETFMCSSLDNISLPNSLVLKINEYLDSSLFSYDGVWEVTQTLVTNDQPRPDTLRDLILYSIFDGDDDWRNRIIPLLSRVQDKEEDFSLSQIFSQKEKIMIDNKHIEYTINQLVRDDTLNLETDNKLNSLVPRIQEYLTTPNFALPSLTQKMSLQLIVNGIFTRGQLLSLSVSSLQQTIKLSLSAVKTLRATIIFENIEGTLKSLYSSPVSYYLLKTLENKDTNIQESGIHSLEQLAFSLFSPSLQEIEKKNLLPYSSNLVESAETFFETKCYLLDYLAVDNELSTSKTLNILHSIEGNVRKNILLYTLVSNFQLTPHYSTQIMSLLALHSVTASPEKKSQIEIMLKTLSYPPLKLESSNYPLPEDEYRTLLNNLFSNTGKYKAERIVDFLSTPICILPISTAELLTFASHGIMTLGHFILPQFVPIHHKVLSKSNLTKISSKLPSLDSIVKITKELTKQSPSITNLSFLTPNEIKLLNNSKCSTFAQLASYPSLDSTATAISNCLQKTRSILKLPLYYLESFVSNDFQLFEKMYKQSVTTVHDLLLLSDEQLKNSFDISWNDILPHFSLYTKKSVKRYQPVFTISNTLSAIIKNKKIIATFNAENIDLISLNTSREKILEKVSDKLILPKIELILSAIDLPLTAIDSQGISQPIDILMKKNFKYVRDIFFLSLSSAYAILGLQGKKLQQFVQLFVEALAKSVNKKKTSGKTKKSLTRDGKPERGKQKSLSSPSSSKSQTSKKSKKMSSSKRSSSPKSSSSSKRSSSPKSSSSSKRSSSPKSSSSSKRSSSPKSSSSSKRSSSPKSSSSSKRSSSPKSSSSSKRSSSPKSSSSSKRSSGSKSTSSSKRSSGSKSTSSSKRSSGSKSTSSSKRSSGSKSTSSSKRSSGSKSTSSSKRSSGSKSTPSSKRSSGSKSASSKQKTLTSDS